MGLLPLEFTDCLTDSPYFRENLHAHEEELDKTNRQIKGLIKEVKELLSAAKTLSKAQRNLANTLTNFTFECIGTERTDDEIVIAGSLKEFGRLLHSIEDERDRMLERASQTFIEPIESFRSHQIGEAKEGKKKFDKETMKFCSSLERHLNLSTRKSENHLQEADANLGMEQHHFVQASLSYILKLQEVHERKKFEFVETILSFMYGWLTFYHQGHEVAKDFKSYMTDLQVRLQRSRDSYTSTQHEAENLMSKMLEARKTKPQDTGTLNKMYTRQGYLFLQEKKTFGPTGWIKHFCQYQKEDRRFTMIPYNQTVSKINQTETITLKECVRRMSDSIDKRFCFDIIPQEKPSTVYTFQALSEEDRKLWLDAMDGQDPVRSSAGNLLNDKKNEYCLDEVGFLFVRKCIEFIEARGLEDQGLYRVGGVGSKINKLIHSALDRRTFSENGFQLNCDDWEVRTVTSALKQFFRNLPEPLLTYKHYHAFIAAAKYESKAKRVDTIHFLIHDLPKVNFDMLHILARHLSKVAGKSDKNFMTISNLGVCFGPTLLRPEEDSMAGILEIKFGNVVVEMLIEYWDKIFNSKPAQNGQMVSQPGGDQMPSPSNYSYGAVGGSDHVYSQIGHSESSNLSSYATVPSRGIVYSSPGHVPRSSSHDQLSRQHQPYHAKPPHSSSFYGSYHSPGMTSSPSSTLYTSPNLMYQPTTKKKQQQPMLSQVEQVPHPGSAVGEGEIPPQRTGGRPVAVYSSWSSQPNIIQPQDQSMNSLHLHDSETSPVTSSGSSNDSLPVIIPSPSPSPSLPSSTLYPNSTGGNTGINGRTPGSNSGFNSGSNSGFNSGFLSTINTGRTVRALYNCVGENSTELSFEPNAIIYNVRRSKEPGWLEGSYNGRTGLIPENYVQFIS